MQLRSRLRRSLPGRFLFAAVLALPLMAGTCEDLTGTKPNYDGTYTLVSVDGYSLPYDIIRVDSRNRLSLTRGEWQIVGTTLMTRMWTTSYINGSATSEARFNPEKHVGTITFGDGTAEATLDSGSSIYAEIGKGYVVYSSSGHTLRFEKQ